jgi:hypothetical protein
MFQPRQTPSAAATGQTPLVWVSPAARRGGASGLPPTLLYSEFTGTAKNTGKMTLLPAHLRIEIVKDLIQRGFHHIRHIPIFKEAGN